MIRSLLALCAVLAVASAKKPVYRDDVINVHMFPHTHDDVGWLKTVDQYSQGLNNSIQHAYVHMILDSVTRELAANPDRKFVYVEQAFFQRWWNQQTDAWKDTVKTLVKNEQLAFINGGWCMHDEAALHYVAGIDQTTVGHRFLKDEFDYVPTIGWQIDPFGHSSTQASLLSADAGFDGLFFGRIDYQDHDTRMNERRMEFIWRASQSAGADSQVFTGAFQSGNYGPPSGFCFDVRCNDLPIQDDPTLEDYNVKSRVDDFVAAVMDHYNHSAQTGHMSFNFGSDFMHEASNNWFSNLDKLIKHVNADGRVNAFYSTPQDYVKAQNAAAATWTVKTDDFFPYADRAHAFWTGYFTSRPALKGYVRSASGYLQGARQLEAFLAKPAPNSALQMYDQAIGVAQHHDAVSGTSKQHVAYDYAKRIAKGEAIADSQSVGLLKDKVVEGHSGAAAPDFARCHQLNVSVCAVSQSSDAVTVVLYNPMSQSQHKNMLLPLPAAATGATVTGPTGEVLKSGIVTNTLPSQDGSAAKSVAFVAPLPPMGFSTFFVTTTTAAVDQTVDIEVASGPTKVSNGNVQLEYDTSGNLQSITNVGEGLTVNATQQWMWYNSSAGYGQNSGAYIFRPNGTHPWPVASGDVTLSVQTTDPVTIVTQTWSSWLVQETRLWAGSSEVEVEFHVGPVPFDNNWGHEVITRINTTIASGSTCYTDSNGREMQKRVFNYRPTWKLNQTEPVAGNYYPVNAMAYIKDSSAQLTVLTDRSEGGGSLTSGELEIMVHRRLMYDDSRGVGEPLNETQGITPYPNPHRIGTGLEIRGTHKWQVASPSTAMAAARPGADRMFFRPIAYVAPLTTSPSAYIGDHVTTASWLNASLPTNVAVITLRRWNSTGLLLRLAHQFSVGEDANLSKPATVDVGTMFPSMTISSMSELGLTANQPISNIKKLNWKTTSNVNAVPQYPRKVPVEGTAVTLAPMEIRTFFLETN